MASGVEAYTGTGQGEFIPDHGFLSALVEPFGPMTVCLAVGPLRMSLKGLSARQVRFIEDRFGPFLLRSDSAADVRIDLRRAGVDHFLRWRGARHGETYRLESRGLGARTIHWSYEFAGMVEAPERRAVLAVVRSEGDLFERGLENFLRILTASFVLDRGGFLLHAAAVVRGGRAYVYFGPSGSGKTTVTDLSPGDLVLSDDLTLVVHTNGRYEAAGIPFGLAHHHVPDTRAAYPIASFNRLVQSRDVRRDPLTGARALAEMLGSLPFVMREPSLARRAVEVVGRALADIPAHCLKFRKDDAFWSLVEDGQAAQTAWGVQGA